MPKSVTSPVITAHAAATRTAWRVATPRASARVAESIPGVIALERTLSDATPGRSGAAQPAPFALEEITINELQTGMKSGKYTARSITESYLSRITASDQTTTNAVIELNPDALAMAEQLDRERALGNVRGALHGIPMLIKDNIDTADKMQTTAGSLALANTIAPRDATIVEQLRAAGAVLLGKTNLSEWAIFVRANLPAGGAGAAA